MQLPALQTFAVAGLAVRSFRFRMSLCKCAAAWHACGHSPADAPFQATAATPLYIKSASVLPSSVPDDPNASFGVGVPLTRENKGTSAATPSPAKSAAAAPAGGAAPKPAGGNVEATKKPPALFKPKASVVGFKKPVFKKM